MEKITRDFVSTVFIVKDKKVLLVKHKKIGLWLPPGGHIDKDETPDEAAVREIKEETGLDIDVKPQIFNKIKILNLHHVEIHPIGKDHEHVSFTYFTKPIGGTLTHNPKEHDKIKWFSKEELDKDDITIEVRHFGKMAIDEVE